MFPAGERFAYNNGGYVVLALIAERASGVDYHDLVRTLVCEPAGMVDTGFLRSDELPGRAALGYLTADGLRTNVFHLPVLGTGDGGAYTTAADLSAFWDALFAGRIVPPERVAEMIAPPQRLARGVEALRPRVPPRRGRRPSLARGVRRGRVDPQPARPVIGHRRTQ